MLTPTSLVEALITKVDEVVQFEGLYGTVRLKQVGAVARSLADVLRNCRCKTI